MRKDYEKLFTHLEPPEPPAGLFDRIILAIRREQELRNTKRVAFGFLALLVVSLTAAPFSWTLFAGQIRDSGMFQFIEAALSDLGAFFASWQEFSLAIAESLPVAGAAIFTVNMILAVFTLRLFLYKKRLLDGYLLQSI
ncbi:MAG: hypothetical protein Q8R12_00285 [bacterium]|nr:hypothetical protein [bacterium]